MSAHLVAYAMAAMCLAMFTPPATSDNGTAAVAPPSDSPAKSVEVKHEVCTIENASEHDAFIMYADGQAVLLPAGAAVEVAIPSTGTLHVALCCPLGGETDEGSFLLAGATLRAGDRLHWSDRLDDVVDASKGTHSGPPRGDAGTRDDGRRTHTKDVHRKDDGVDSNTAPKVVVELLTARLDAQGNVGEKPIRWNAHLLDQAKRVVGTGSLTITGSGTTATKRPYLLTGPGIECVWVEPGVVTTYRAVSRQHTSSTASVSTGFWCSITELTRGQAAFVRAEPKPGSPDMPQGGMSHTSAAAFVVQLREHVPNAAMPTEVQWQLACEAGRRAPFGRAGDPSTFIWAQRLDDNKPIMVASLLPNDFGIYDMHGNLFELCVDYWNPNAHSGVDPVHNLRHVMRARRGGSALVPRMRGVAVMFEMRLSRTLSTTMQEFA